MYNDTLKEIKKRNGSMEPRGATRVTRSVWSELWTYAKPYKMGIACAVFAAISGTLLSLVGPSYISVMTDLIEVGLTSTIDMEAVFQVGLKMTLIFSLGALLLYAQGYITATVTQKITYRLREDISRKLNVLPLYYFDQTNFGDILSRMTNDVDTISQTLNQSVGTLMTGLILFVGALVIMFATSFPLALTAVGSSALGFLLTILILKKSQVFFNRQQHDLGRMNGHIEESYSGQTIIKVYNAQTEAKEDFHLINRDLYDSAWKSQFLSGLMMPLMTFIGNIGYVAVCVVGGALAFNGTISFGVVVVFLIYVRLFTQPLAQLAQAATRLQSASAAGDRVFEFLYEEELSDETNKCLTLTDVRGDVDFQQVQFGYDPETPVIREFTLSVSAGDKIAIVGPTGAGKTTLVNLLMRFYEIDKGDILIDGVSIQDITRENLHDLFCMVLQDTWLFEGTIKENLIYNNEERTEGEVEAVCKAVGLDHFIRTLPDGYNTVLNDQANLSVGQKQMLTIGRAMLDDAPLLILDEATSSVDTRTELTIQQAMDTLMIGRTSFVIAHRLSTIKNADKILVMQDGDIVESGTHDELLQRKGAYAHLYNSQFT